MKFAFILITILINFSNPLLIKSEERFVSKSDKPENLLKKESLNQKNSKIKKIHIVKVGDTISNISNFYSIDKNLIIKLNDLKDENYIYIGQNLIISNNNQDFKEETSSKVQGNKDYHIVQEGENLTEISSKYNLKLEYLININNLNNPDSIEVGKKLLLSKTNQIYKDTITKLKDNEINVLNNINKKTYGPLTIESKKFKKLNRRQTLNVRNQSDQELILSIRCETKELDVRIPGRKWKGWKPAKKEFEQNLINDLC